MMLRRLRLDPFFQEYWPIPGVPSRLPAGYFDMDLDEVIRLTFRSNGQNWEKYLRWLNRLYFVTYGRYYRPLVETLYRYNHKAGIRRFLESPGSLTTRLYHLYAQPGRPVARRTSLRPAGVDGCGRPVDSTGAGRPPASGITAEPSRAREVPSPAR